MASLLLATTVGGYGVIHSNNIGSQSVSYATSAGNSDTVDSLHASSFVRNDTTRQYLKPYFEYSEYLTTQSPLDLVNQMGGGGFRVDFLHPSYTANGNWGHVMTWSGYNGYTMYQMSGSYGAGADVELYVRNETNHGRGAWSSWRRLLHDNNYNSYSPTLTGTGASGTWGISITGNANTATTAGSAPNASNLNASYGVTAGAGNGLKFWGGDDTYKISMGNSAEYHYGPVTDYSIKTVIDSVGATRGFTWGVNGGTPIAALNVGNGNMQIAGTFTASNFSGSSSGTNTGDQTNISGNAATATNAVAASNLSLTSLGTASVNVNNGSSAVYRNENGSGGNLSYAPVLHLGGGDTMWQIQGDYYDSSTLRWRAGYNGTWYAWRDIIHSGNIASQSVASATDASTLGGFGRGNTTNKVAYFDGTRNLYVNNPETYTGEVRLGAAWNRGGVYASNTLTMSTSSGAIDFVSNDTILGGFRWASTTGSRFIVGEGVTTTPYTLIDTNKRPVIYARGPYPVLTLDHTETSNAEHGPTIQFAFNGSNARQWVIGCGGSGNFMDFGFSSSGYSNTNYNPHNGISGYQGNTIMRIIDSRVGIGGDWGAYGSVANPEHTLDVRGTIFSNTDMRAPIFYDSQDTNYYVDPNSTSKLVQVNLGTVNTRLISDAGVGYLKIYGSASNHLGIGPYDNNGWVYFENIGNSTGTYFNSPGRYAFDSVDVTPYTDNENSLGSGSYRWANIYTGGWLRNYGAQGMYNESYGTHFYSNGSGSWGITGSGGAVELQFRSNHQSTLRGYVYADTSNNIGFLSEDGNWVLRTFNRGV